MLHEAMQLGAADYLRKPFDVEELLFKIQRALERRTLQLEIQHWRALARTSQAADPVGTHPLYLRTREQVRTLSSLSSDLLLVGEAGTGKTLLARWSHAMSPQCTAPLVELDLSNLTWKQIQILLEGAAGREGGRQMVGAGTFLLRHAPGLSTETWERLMQIFLSQREGSRPRIVLTSEQPPPETRAFEHIPKVQVPALREHAEDIILLVRAFALSSVVTLPALHLLECYPWPGNIAELRQVIRRAAALVGNDPLEERHLPERIRQAPVPGLPIRLPLEGVNLAETEIALLRQALAQSGGNKTRAAELLGLTRHTLLYRLGKYGLGSSEQEEPN